MHKSQDKDQPNLSAEQKELLVLLESCYQKGEEKIETFLSFSSTTRQDLEKIIGCKYAELINPETEQMYAQKATLLADAYRIHRRYFTSNHLHDITNQKMINNPQVMRDFTRDKKLYTKKKLEDKFIAVRNTLAYFEANRTIDKTEESAL